MPLCGKNGWLIAIVNQWNCLVLITIWGIIIDQTFKSEADFICGNPTPNLEWLENGLQLRMMVNYRISQTTEKG